MAAGYGKGWITGDCVKSKPYTHIPQEDWDRIFKKDGKDPDAQKLIERAQELVDTEEYPSI